MSLIGQNWRIWYICDECGEEASLDPDVVRASVPLALEGWEARLDLHGLHHFCPPCLGRDRGRHLALVREES